MNNLAQAVSDLFLGIAEALKPNEPEPVNHPVKVRSRQSGIAIISQQPAIDGSCYKLEMFGRRCRLWQQVRSQYDDQLVLREAPFSWAVVEDLLWDANQIIGCDGMLAQFFSLRFARWANLTLDQAFEFITHIAEQIPELICKHLSQPRIVRWLSQLDSSDEYTLDEYIVCLSKHLPDKKLAKQIFTSFKANCNKK
jgi:hypothetical protein